MRVRLPHHISTKIRAHARAAYPNECCGLLIGKTVADVVDITDIRASGNLTSGDPTKSFEVDPKLRFDVMREAQARNDGFDMIGHYHSHPDGPAEPSATDLSKAYEPQMIWLICGVTKEDDVHIGAFQPRADGSAFDTLKLVIDAS